MQRYNTNASNLGYPVVDLYYFAMQLDSIWTRTSECFVARTQKSGR